MAPTRRERRRAETRERIFRAAMELFAKRGFFNTTVEDITEAADVGKGTFFYYFPSKEHVLGVLHDIQLGKVAAAHAAAREGKLAVREILQNLMHKAAEEPGRSQQLARGLLATLFSSDPIRELMVDAMSRGRRQLEEILALGQSRVEIRQAIPLEATARSFQQCVMGTVMLWSLGPEASLPQRLRATFELFWAGVAAEN
jgi:AcrR family transcriptional regulator